jgi:hypothetical protein
MFYASYGAKHDVHKVLEGEKKDERVVRVTGAPEARQYQTSEVFVVTP